jgi:hypothetical protein
LLLVEKRSATVQLREANVVGENDKSNSGITQILRLVANYTAATQLTEAKVIAEKHNSNNGNY